MAKMFPDRLHPHVKSYAEKKLYRAFQKQLSDNFTIFHSVKWLDIEPHTSTKDNEADFVIAHPDLGILVIEVKGGLIRYNGREGQWYSNKYKIKDPFKQACDNKYNLLNFLKAQPDWRKIWISMGYAVAFPDLSSCDGLPPNAFRQIILDFSQLDNLSDWVKCAMTFWLNEKSTPLTQKNVKKLENVLSPQMGYNLGHTIEWEDRQLKKLSETQVAILNYLEWQSRVAIRGCAGSGKTLLAMEKARRLQEQGLSVLVVCYNKALAQFMRKTLAAKEGLHVYHFHALCTKLTREADIDLDRERGKYSDDFFYGTICPNRMMAAADQLNWRVDAVIVDEGQDFSEDFYTALKYLMKDPDSGIFYYFYDDNQNIYKPCWLPTLEEVPFFLKENWRNTQTIFSYILQFYNGTDNITAIGAEGEPVEILDYTTDFQLKNILSRTLHRLVVDEQVKPQDIVILTTRKMPLIENKFVGQFLIKANPDLNSNQIECHTIHHFKGLECPVVILIESALRQVPNLKNLLYVGASRARNHLIILQPDFPF